MPEGFGLMRRMTLLVISTLIAAGIACFVWGLIILANGHHYVGWPLVALGLMVLVGTYLFYLRNGQRRLPPQSRR